MVLVKIMTWNGGNNNMIRRYKINNYENIYVATRPGEILRCYKKLVQNGYRENTIDTASSYGSFTISRALYVYGLTGYCLKHNSRISYIDMELYCDFNDMYTLRVNNLNRSVEVLKSQTAYRILYKFWSTKRNFT